MVDIYIKDKMEYNSTAKQSLNIPFFIKQQVNLKHRLKNHIL